MIPALIATRHRIGSMRVVDMGKFGGMVQELINNSKSIEHLFVHMYHCYL